MQIRVDSDIDRVIGRLTQQQRQRLPRALARALSTAARQVAGDVSASTARHFDRPTPFTRRAFRGMRADAVPINSVAEARVVILPAQAKYLGLQITGGVRRGRLLIPSLAAARAAGQINAYGNVPRRSTATLPRRRGFFRGAVDGVPGIYRRVGGKIVRVLAWREEQQVRARFPFHAEAKTASIKRFMPAMRQELARITAPRAGTS